MTIGSRRRAISSLATMVFLSFQVSAMNCPVCGSCQYDQGICRGISILDQMVINLLLLPFEFRFSVWGSASDPEQYSIQGAIEEGLPVAQPNAMPPSGEAMPDMENEIPHPSDGITFAPAFPAQAMQISLLPILPGITDNYSLYTEVMEEFRDLVSIDNRFSDLNIQHFIETYWKPQKEGNKHLIQGSNDWNTFWHAMYLESKRCMRYNFRLAHQVSEALMQMGHYHKAIMLIRVVEFHHPEMTDNMRRVLKKQQSFILGLCGYCYQSLLLLRGVYPDHSGVSHYIYQSLVHDFDSCSQDLTNDQEKVIRAWIATLKVKQRRANGQWRDWQYVK